MNKLIADRNFVVGEISPYIYGSFVEHMGRVVYGGIYEPGHETADEDGFRKDVLEKVKELGVTCVRYPGGNFVSNYDWRDAVGPKETRPRKREIAWKSIETNEFGPDEFMKWTDKAELDPVFAVNLGTKSVENALSFLEYMNMPTGTFYSDLRAKNGHEAPYRVNTWCLGNEMDGAWQIGHKNAEDYGKLAGQVAFAMKSLDPEAKLVVCGSSSTSMQTYTDWERIVLGYTYDFVDYISLHQYYGNQEYGTKDFLAQSLDLEGYIATVRGICQTVKAKKRGNHDIKISIDEWGVWEIPGEEVAKDVESHDWQIAPSFSEQIYTMEDALLFSSMLMAMLKNADIVEIACQSLLTNISACIMTETGGGSWVQTIYYPFAYMAKYGRGTVLQQVRKETEWLDTRFGKAPALDTVLIYNHDRQEVVAFAVNRTDFDQPLTLRLQGFQVKGDLKHIALYSKDLKDTNLENHKLVHPVELNRFSAEKETVVGTIPAYSWNMIRVPVEAFDE